MIFSSKSKGYFIEQTEFSVFLARTSSLESPLTVEVTAELPAGDEEGIRNKLKEWMGKGAAGYARANCAVYPSGRFVRRISLDLKRTKEADYIGELITSQLRVDPAKSSIAVLHADDGSPCDPADTTRKEVVFCGAAAADFVAAQKNLVELGIYPERLELGTTATLGGLVSYARHQSIAAPILLLELGRSATQSFILTANGVDVSRPISHGFEAMIPIVQKELGLKDDESARKLFYSGAFDFTSMGEQLVRKLHKELQAAIGFYEVQTGQSVAHVFCNHLPQGLGWLATSIASSLGVAPLKLDMPPWLEAVKIRCDEGVPAAEPRWLGLFSLMVSDNGLAEAKA